MNIRVALVPHTPVPPALMTLSLRAFGTTTGISIRACTVTRCNGACHASVVLRVASIRTLLSLLETMSEQYAWEVIPLRDGIS